MARVTNLRQRRRDIPEGDIVRLLTGDAEFVGGHVRSLRYRVRRASVWSWPSHRIVGHEVSAPSIGPSG